MSGTTSCTTTTISTSRVVTTYTTTYTSALTTVTPPPRTTIYTTSSCPVTTYYTSLPYYTSSSAYSTSTYYPCTSRYITSYVSGTPYTTYTTIPTTYYQTTTIPTYYPSTTCVVVYTTAGYPTTTYTPYETLGRRADSGHLSTISSKGLPTALLVGGLVFAAVLASLVYHLLFKKWARRSGKMRTFYGAGQRHAQSEELHHTLLHNEKGFQFEGQARCLPHAGRTVYGVEAYMPHNTDNDVDGTMDQKGFGKKTISIEPSRD